MLQKLKYIYANLDIHSIEVIKKSFSSMIVKISGMIIGLIVSVALARLLGAEGFGIINLASKIVAIITILGLLGIPQVIIKEVSIGRTQENWKHIGDVMHTSYILSGLVTLGVSLVCIFLAPWISEHIFNEEKLTFPLIVALLVLTPQVFSRLFSSGLIGYRKIWQSNLVDQTLSVAVVGVLLAICYISKVEITINLVAILYAIGRLVVTISIGLYWKKLYAHKLKRTFISKKILNTSMPLMLVSASLVISSSVDSVMIGWLSSAKQVGFFSVALKLALLTSFFMQITISTLAPKIAALYNSGKHLEMQQMVKQITKGLTIIGALVLGTVIIFGKFILSIWGEEFTEAYWILVVLGIGQFFNIASGPVGNLLAMTNNEKILRNITLITLVLNVIFNIFFIVKFEALGAAIATATTVALNMVISSIYVKKKLGFLPLNLKFF